MSKAAFVLRRFTDAGAGLRHPANSVIKNLTAGQFHNFETAGLVRAATPGEVRDSEPMAEPAPAQSERAIAVPPPPPKPKRKRARKPS